MTGLGPGTVHKLMREMAYGRIQPARWNSRGATCRRKPLCSASRVCHDAIFGIGGRCRAKTSHRKTAAPVGISPRVKRFGERDHHWGERNAQAQSHTHTLAHVL